LGTRYSLSASIYQQADSSSGGTPTIARNCIVENSGGSGSWSSQLGVDGGGNLDMDPRFVAEMDPNTAPTVAGDLRLQSTSPCIAAGLNTADLDLSDPGTEIIMDVNVGIEGEARIVGAFIDMGAFEFDYGGFPDVDHDGLPNDYERNLTMPSSDTALDPLADGDGDQSGELLEWMLGMDRIVTDVSLLPVVFPMDEAGARYLAISYRRNRLALGSLSIEVERSTDLGITDFWDSDETVEVSVTPVVGEPGIEIVVERSIFPISGGLEMLRLKGESLSSP
jgi:hypothetical protein